MLKQSAAFLPSAPLLLPLSPARSLRTRPPLCQITPPPVPEKSWNADDDLLTRLNSLPSAPIVPQANTPSYGELSSSITYLRTGLSKDVDKLLSSPRRLITSSIISILFGFFSATSASTIIGSVADWDPLAAAVLLIWTESFTKLYYSLPTRSRFLQLVNAFKIGLVYGMIVDAFKLST